MSSIEEEKIKKLKYMRKLATGLLVLMALVYISLRRFADNSFLISCIVAFAEASMVGALADWFAVVALFRHPLGMKWIPHTAIIQQNQSRIGESLASFVVNNFFTEEVLRSKLSKLDLTKNILNYVKENKLALSSQIAANIPEILKYIIKDNKITTPVKDGAVRLLQATDVNPYISNMLSYVISSKMHFPLIKQLVSSLSDYVENNKEETMNIFEGINKALALPIIGDLTYRSVVKSLSSLNLDIQQEIPTKLTKEILYNLPEQLVQKFNNSHELHDKIENKKNEFILSEGFADFVEDKINGILDSALSYTVNSKDELTIKVSGYIDNVISDFEENAEMLDKIENWIESLVIKTVSEYSGEIGKLISDTVKDWPMDDMVEKLEIQVGGDLQYIRINGTIIGGLAGLAIHLLTTLL